MIFGFIVRRRIFVILLSLCLLLACAWGLTKLSIDPNNRAFFSHNHSKYVDLLRLEDKFGSNTELLYVLSAHDGLDGSAQLSSAVRWVTERVWTIEGVRSVDSLASYPYILSESEDIVVVNALDFACDASGPCDSDKLDQISFKYLQGRIISADHKAASIVAKVDLGDHSNPSVLRIAAQANRLKQEISERFNGVDAYLTGGVPMMEAFFVAAKKDAATLMPTALLVVFLVLAVFLGSLIQATFLAMLGVASVVMTMGLAGWSGYTLNTATATAPLVVFTLVVTSSMHLFMQLSIDIADFKSDQVVSRVVTAAKSNFVPIFLTTLTTAIGFLSMVTVSAPPIKELGILAAFGVVTGATLSLLVAPAVFVAFPRVMISRRIVPLAGLIDRYAKWIETSRSKYLLSATLTILSILGIARINFDEDFVRYFSERTSFRVDTEQISMLMAGPYHIDVVYDSGMSGGIFAGEAIHDLSRISAYFEADDRVVNVLSFVDVLRKISNAFAPDIPIEHASADQLAQYFLTYELSLDRGQSTLDFVDREQRFARASILLRDVSMGDIRDIVERAERWVQSDLGGRKITLTGEGVPTAYLSGESISEMTWGISLSMVLSGLVVALWLKRAMIFVVVLMAMVVPLLAGFGIWGWFGGEIGMAATLVIATTIGVVVDDTIHIAYRYLDGRKIHDLPPSEAAGFSVRKAGPAVFGTSIGFVAGFLVLVLSEFQMNSTFGLCASLVITIALIYNLTVSPRLLRAIV